MRHKFRLDKLEYKQRAVRYPGAVQMPTKRLERTPDHEARARMLEAVREVLGRDLQRPTD
jgi:hypothetical protein